MLGLCVDGHRIESYSSLNLLLANINMLNVIVIIIIIIIIIVPVLN
jgi:hypothetical protein